MITFHINEVSSLFDLTLGCEKKDVSDSKLTQSHLRVQGIKLFAFKAQVQAYLYSTMYRPNSMYLYCMYVHVC